MRFSQECESAGGWLEIEVPSRSDPKKVYSVTLTPWDRTLDEALCDCPGYSFRGHCSHQRIALDQVCGWTDSDPNYQQTHEQKREHICPKCGERTRLIIQ